MQISPLTLQYNMPELRDKFYLVVLWHPVLPLSILENLGEFFGLKFLKVQLAGSSQKLDTINAVPMKSANY